MLRTILISMLGLVLLAGAISFAAGAVPDTLLGQCPAGADELQLSERTDGAGHSVLALSAGSASSRQSFNLQTPGFPQTIKSLASLLKLEATDPANPDNVVAGFGIACAEGDMKLIDVWLRKENGRWSLRGEWAVEKFNHKELGEKDEAQTFEFASDGSLKRTTKRNNIEGIKTTCPQGCCVVWQSRTLITDEVETLTWNPSTRSTDRSAYQRWYITQHGDGVLSIAQKVFGNPARMTTIMRLNPELQKQDALNDDQRVLIESAP